MSDEARDEVWVVIEDRTDRLRSKLLRAFSNPGAANDYVNDPDNAGYLFVERMKVNDEWPEGDAPRHEGGA